MSQTPQHIRDNIVKIVDSTGGFNGTGFLIQAEQDRYCVTCHHCICRLNQVYIAREDEQWQVEWIEDLSVMDKDIAVLRVHDSDVKPLHYAKEAMPQLSCLSLGIFRY